MKTDSISPLSMPLVFLLLALGGLAQLATTPGAEATFGPSSSMALVPLDSSTVVVDEDDDDDDDNGEPEWKIYWKDGTRLESRDGDFEIKFGGRIQADFTGISGDDAIDSRFDLEGGNEFRRARLFFSGTLYERFEFKAQYDFAGGDAEPKDVYLGLTGLPGVGGVQIGHMKEPFGIEQITSSNHIAFAERSFTDEAVTEGRNMGVMLHNQLRDGRITWALGAFRPSDGFAVSQDDVWNVTGRITGLARYRNDGRDLLHLGFAASQRRPANGSTRIRTRPENHLAPRLVDTGSFDADEALLTNVEAAVVQGRFWAATELVRADVDVPVGVDPTFSANKLQVGYFLTDDYRRFKKSAGAWDRQKPKRPWGKGQGPGAWEIAARYSQLDVSDEAIAGGELEGFTLALNWYPNSSFRAMLNFVQSELEDVGDVESVIFRAQVTF